MSFILTFSFLVLVNFLPNKTLPFSFQTDEITYAELSIANQQMPQVIYRHLRHQEPTVYAQIDLNHMQPHHGMQSHHGMQPLSPPHPVAFQALHHQLLPPYVPRSLRDEQHLHEGSVSSETPLLTARDTSVSTLV